jgi:hypothetical protein
MRQFTILKTAYLVSHPETTQRKLSPGVTSGHLQLPAYRQKNCSACRQSIRVAEFAERVRQNVRTNTLYLLSSSTEA